MAISAVAGGMAGNSRSLSLVQEHRRRSTRRRRYQIAPPAARLIDINMTAGDFDDDVIGHIDM
jgi:hypothetical protein